MEKILRFIQYIAAPLRAEWMFFIITFLLLAQQPIDWLTLPSSDRWYQWGMGLKSLAVETGLVWVLTWVVWKSHSRLVKYLLTAVAWLLLGITLFLSFNFEMNISQQTLTVLVETTSKESGEFVNTYMWSPESQLSYTIDACLAIVIIVLYCIEGKLHRTLRRPFHSFATDLVAGTVATVGLGFFIYAWGTLLLASNSTRVYRWRNGFATTSLDIGTQSAHAINSLRAFGNDVRMAVKQAREVYRTHPTVQESDSLTVIYVLGESYIKHHASLYGYELNTTPCMVRERNRGNLFAFTDVIAQENITSVVEKNTFCLNSVADGESWFEKPNFTTIFKRAGYNVYMWDIQRTQQPHKLFTVTVNQFVYNPEIMRLSYTACDKGGFDYDGQLVDDFHKRVKLHGKHNLIVFHLYGQHVNPHYRYPAGSYYDNHFKPDSVRRNEKWLTTDKKQKIAYYDNATLYNDAVMEKIFDLYRNKNTVVVYFADHGEEVYDFRDTKGRHTETDPKPGTLMYQNEVPFVIWCSDRYKQLHPQVVARIKQALHRPYMTDNVGQLMLDLGRIKTQYYIPDRDLIAPQFRPRKRLVYDHCDYDKVMRGVDRNKIYPRFVK
ncbi:phosphoethanolamine transferase [Sodaliphilus pleomorphus]|uniref:Phosphoethanolamine transferase n=1 Tax=Sodaliphilus pleomorphus TaxID=2606626 RepID=A0A6L5XG56_9BACT|nr:phosphoethanolamine transferase [Sodaliphilus pleomorphus]MSS18489.1 phosphoethanolamine transferase [Sodaliphilus pleomorphus]